MDKYRLEMKNRLKDERNKKLTDKEKVILKEWKEKQDEIDNYSK